jgi:uncharacterized membrane protein
MRKFTPFLLLLLLGGVNAALSVSSTISPTSIYPNYEGIITVTVTSTTLQNDVRINVQSSELTLDRSTSDLGQIQENGQRSGTFKFTAPATAGFYIVNFEVAYGTQRTYHTAAVNVIGEPEFSITGKDPQTIYSGQENSFNITVENTGYKDVTNPIFELVVPNYFSVLGTNRKTFDELSVGEDEVLDFNVFIDRDAVPGTYEFTFNTLYPGGTDTQTFHIPVIGVPNLEIAGVTFDPENVQPSKASTIAVRFENTGTAEAKSVKAALSSSAITGQKEDYLGSMDIDDTSSAVFDIVSPILAGEFSLNLDVTFMDEYGNSYSEQFVVAMPVVAGEMDITNFLYLIIAVLVIFILFTRRRKK